MTQLSAADDPLALAPERVALSQAMLEAQESWPVRLIETHISWVLLLGTLAYKFKKPVRMPFLDSTTLAARRRFCDKELRLKQRLAPVLYLDGVEVRDSPRSPAFGCAGRVLDEAVPMRRFPDRALWREMLDAGTLAPRHMDAMAQKLWGFHRNAAVAPPGNAFGTAASHQRMTAQLVDSVAAWLAQTAPANIWNGFGQRPARPGVSVCQRVAEAERRLCRVAGASFLSGQPGSGACAGNGVERAAGEALSGSMRPCCCGRNARSSPGLPHRC